MKLNKLKKFLKSSCQFFAVFFIIIYLIWRLVFTLPLSNGLVMGVFGIILLGCEAVSNITAFYTIYLKYASRKQGFYRKKTLGEVSRLPHVDLFICTHNEDCSILRKTIIGALRIQYPSKKLHIYVSDDGNRKEVSGLCKDLGVGYFSVKGNKHAKSGNLNYSLKRTSSELVAFFDADMIPFSSFLEDTVPYFSDSEEQTSLNKNLTNLAMVQTPQYFYNPDIFQFNLNLEHEIINEQDFFSKDINVLTGLINQNSIFTGSNALFKRAALEKVGYFPTDSLTEDFSLSILLVANGYQTISTRKPSASGVSPTEVSEVVKQRVRWARGVIQSCQSAHIFLNRKITLKKKLAFWNSYFYWWSFFRRLVFILSPLLFVFTGIKIVDANFGLLLIMWAPGYILLHFLLNESGDKLRSDRLGEIQEQFYSLFLVFPVILETFRIRERKFKVTNKSVVSSYKKNIELILIGGILWLLCLIGIIKFNMGKFGSEIMNGSIVTFWLIMHFINLTLALSTAIPRKHYRMMTRFPREGKVSFFYKNSTRKLEGDILDVSEKGLSVILNNTDNNIVIENINTKNLEIINHQRKIIMKNNSFLIKRFFEKDESKEIFVGLEFDKEIDDLDYTEFIYNGVNQDLPEQQNQMLTIFDCLLINFKNFNHKIKFLKESFCNWK